MYWYVEISIKDEWTWDDGRAETSGSIQTTSGIPHERGEDPAFSCEDDTTNIIRVAPALKIGLLEFEEIPGEECDKKRKTAQNGGIYKSNPDMEAEPAVWERETLPVR